MIQCVTRFSMGENRFIGFSSLYEIPELPNLVTWPHLQYNLRNVINSCDDAIDKDYDVKTSLFRWNHQNWNHAYWENILNIKENQKNDNFYIKKLNAEQVFTFEFLHKTSN